MTNALIYQLASKIFQQHFSPLEKEQGQKTPNFYYSPDQKWADLAGNNKGSVIVMLSGEKEQLFVEAEGLIFENLSRQDQEKFLSNSKTAWEIFLDCAEKYYEALESNAKKTPGEKLTMSEKVDLMEKHLREVVHNVPKQDEKRIYSIATDLSEALEENEISPEDMQAICTYMGQQGYLPSEKRRQDPDHRKTEVKKLEERGIFNREDVQHARNVIEGWKRYANFRPSSPETDIFPGPPPKLISLEGRKRTGVPRS